MTQLTVTESERRRTVSVLFLAQSFFTASTIAAFTLSPIIASTLSGSEANLGMPNTLTLVGRAAFAYPLGYLMERIGRRLALSSGYGFAVLGSVVSIWAILNSSYAAFLLGALLLGMARSASDQSRYVGAEVYPLERRARIIGIIVAAGAIGAIAGPVLVPLSASFAIARGLPEAIGPFIVAGAAMVLATLTVFLFLRPDPGQMARVVAGEEASTNPESIENVVREARPLLTIFRAPMVQLAILSMLIGYFVMVFLMVVTPVHMDHHDHTTAAISAVIMAHTLGMYGVSWFTGWLIDRFGTINMILAGAAVLVASCITAPLSLQVPILGLSLFLLGLGWNFCFVAGSSLLSNSLAVQERARAQGASEALVAIASGIASLTVGTVFRQGDFLLVSAIGLVLTLLLVAATAVLVRRNSRQAPLSAPAD